MPARRAGLSTHRCPGRSPSASPPCPDLPGTPRGAAGEIPAPRAPEEQIAPLPPYPHPLAWVQGLGGDRSPPPPRKHSAPLAALSAGTAILAQEEPQHSRGRQAASQPRRETFYLPPSVSPPPFPSSKGPRGHFPSPPLSPSLPPRARLVLRTGAATPAAKRGGRRAPLRLRGSVQGARHEEGWHRRRWQESWQAGRANRPCHRSHPRRALPCRDLPPSPPKSGDTVAPAFPLGAKPTSRPSPPHTALDRDKSLSLAATVALFPRWAHKLSTLGLPGAPGGSHL